MVVLSPFSVQSTGICEVLQHYLNVYNYWLDMCWLNGVALAANYRFYFSYYIVIT